MSEVATGSKLIELPKYRCHKEVWALKIKQVIPSSKAGTGYLNPHTVRLVFEDERYFGWEMSEEYVRKHEPKAGGYWVRYADGYESWSPAEAFESGYTLIE
jgi:hypothetical protein